MQGSKVYVGNLNYATTEDDLRTLFSAYGSVTTVNVIEGRGFGFVEMSNSDEAEKAKEALNDTEFKGRTIKVDEARPPRKKFNDRGGRGGGGYNRY
ncbi:RNA-binding protein [bacterium]|nr:RNA-binding protein [bacterium]